MPQPAHPEYIDGWQGHRRGLPVDADPHHSEDDRRKSLIWREGWIDAAVADISRIFDGVRA